MAVVCLIGIARGPIELLRLGSQPIHCRFLVTVRLGRWIGVLPWTVALVVTKLPLVVPLGGPSFRVPRLIGVKRFRNDMTFAIA